ncbi:hypothetical protein HDU93_001498 [Gonapodya sp. JEL0774]|nr:hypothetical protein HDU93_001498 [Gonapodya sp. JEL0774]
MQWVNTIIHPYISKTSEGQKYYYSDERSKLFGLKTRMQNSQVADRDGLLPEFRSALLPVRTVVRTQKFIGGEEPNYADICLFSAFLWMRASSPFYPKLLLKGDPVYQWRERMKSYFADALKNAVGFDDENAKL